MPDQRVIRVFIADDHDTVIAGIRSILDKESDIQVVGEIRSGKDIINAIIESQADVVLMDIKMQDFNIRDTIKALAVINGDPAPFRRGVPRVIIVSAHQESYLATEAAQYGVAGYLFKEDGLSKTLPSSIRKVADGGLSYSERIEGLIQGKLPQRDPAQLNSYQFEVLCMMVDGHKAPEIAALMDKSQNAIHQTQSRLRVKLDVESNEEAILLAIKEKIVPLGTTLKDAGNLNGQRAKGTPNE